MVLQCWFDRLDRLVQKGIAETGTRRSGLGLDQEVQFPDQFSVQFNKQRFSATSARTPE
jgi:hypothetical protein